MNQSHNPSPLSSILTYSYYNYPIILNTIISIPSVSSTSTHFLRLKLIIFIGVHTLSWKICSSGCLSSCSAKCWRTAGKDSSSSIGSLLRFERGCSHICRRLVQLSTRIVFILGCRVGVPFRRTSWDLIKFMNWGKDRPSKKVNEPRQSS